MRSQTRINIGWTEIEDTDKNPIARKELIRLHNVPFGDVYFHPLSGLFVIVQFVEDGKKAKWYQSNLSVNLFNP